MGKPAVTYVANEYVLEVSNLRKEFGTSIAVNNLSFCAKRGEILGLLGPNGAGKTTTMHMLLGLTTPTSGEISYFGKNFFSDRSEILSRVGFASAYAKLPAQLTVSENLHIFARLYGLSWADRV